MSRAIERFQLLSALVADPDYLDRIFEYMPQPFAFIERHFRSRSLRGRLRLLVNYLDFYCARPRRILWQDCQSMPAVILLLGLVLALPLLFTPIWTLGTLLIGLALLLAQIWFVDALKSGFRRPAVNALILSQYLHSLIQELPSVDLVPDSDTGEAERKLESK